MKYIYFFIVLFCTSLILHSQQTSEVIKEKLYLSFDKEAYAPGEQIQFEAYFVDAASHMPVSNSRSIHVELINRENTILSKVLINPDSVNLYDGYLPIPATIESGVYSVRAYTLYMKNRTGSIKDNTGYLFRKRIQIGSCRDTLTSELNDYIENPTDYLQFMSVADHVSPGISNEDSSSTLDETGMQMIKNLSDMGILVEKVSESSNDFSYYEKLCSSLLNKKEIEKKKATYTDELLVYLPGMLRYRNYFQSMSKGAIHTENPCIVVVNGEVMQSYFDINRIPISSITSIGVIFGPRMTVFGQGGAPVIDRNRSTVTAQSALVISTRGHNK